MMDVSSSSAPSLACQKLRMILVANFAASAKNLGDEASRAPLLNPAMKPLQ
jgi:hypothetical protein